MEHHESKHGKTMSHALASYEVSTWVNFSRSSFKSPLKEANAEICEILFNKNFNPEFYEFALSYNADKVTNSTEV